MLYGQGAHYRKNSLAGIGEFAFNRKIIQVYIFDKDYSKVYNPYCRKIAFSLLRYTKNTKGKIQSIFERYLVIPWKIDAFGAGSALGIPKTCGTDFPKTKLS